MHQDKKTPLMRATEKGHVAVMECLLAHGADINARGYVCIDPIRALCDVKHCVLKQLRVVMP